MHRRIAAPALRRGSSIFAIAINEDVQSAALAAALGAYASLQLSGRQTSASAKRG